MIPTDGRFRLDVTALARAVADDRSAGFNPVAVCANAGAASTGAIDPLEAMADFCEAEGIWLHIDAAYGGFAVVTEEGKRLLRGVERADSIGLDAHKWFFQPYEAGCLLVKDLRTLERAFTQPVGEQSTEDTQDGADAVEGGSDQPGRNAGQPQFVLQHGERRRHLPDLETHDVAGGERETHDVPACTFKCHVRAQLQRESGWSAPTIVLQGMDCTLSTPGRNLVRAGPNSAAGPAEGAVSAHPRKT